MDKFTTEALTELPQIAASVHTDDVSASPKAPSGESFVGAVHTQIAAHDNVSDCQKEADDAASLVGSTPTMKLTPSDGAGAEVKSQPSKNRHIVFSDERRQSQLPMNTPTSVAWEIHICDAKNPNRFRHRHNIAWHAQTIKSQAPKATVCGVSPGNDDDQPGVTALNEMMPAQLAASFDALEAAVSESGSESTCAENEN